MANLDLALKSSNQSVAGSTAFLSFVLILTVVSGVLDFSLYVPLALIFGFCFYWSLKNTSVWMFLIMLSHILILRSTEEITAGEVVFGVFYFGTISVWFVKKFARRERIMSSMSELYLVSFLVLCLYSIFPALINGANVVKWFRELLIFLAYLMYFPLKDSLRDRQGLYWVGAAFLMIVFFAAINSFLRYFTAASSAFYAWQLLSGRQSANEALFVSGALIGIPLFLYVRSLALKTALLSLISFFLLALVFTFSRGYWIGLFVGIATLFLTLQGKPRRELLLASLFLSLGGLAILFIGFRDLGVSILQTVGRRLLGLGGGTILLDLSLQSRIAETQVVMEKILQNPILGWGLGSFIRFHDPLIGSIRETWYIHNGYLFLWLKLGIAGVACYLIFHYHRLRTAMGLFKLRKDKLEGYLLAGIVSILVSMLFISVSSPQFITRESVFIIAVCWGIIDALHETSYKFSG